MTCARGWIAVLGDFPFFITAVRNVAGVVAGEGGAAQGDEPGLYGGTRRAARCDKRELVRFLVKNHGYRGGRATAFHALLQAGVAVLLDAQGVPAVRCDCGNPLLRPDSGLDLVVRTRRAGQHERHADGRRHRASHRLRRQRRRGDHRRGDR